MVRSPPLGKEEDSVRQRSTKQDEKSSVHKQEGYKWERREWRKDSRQMSQSSYGKSSSKIQKMFGKAEGRGRMPPKLPGSHKLTSQGRLSKTKKSGNVTLPKHLLRPWGTTKEIHYSCMAIGKFLLSCYVPNSFSFASLIHLSVCGDNPDTEETCVQKCQLGDNPQPLMGRWINKKISKYRVKEQGAWFWKKKVVEIGWKNEASFPNHTSSVISPKAMALKQTAKINIMPSEMNLILSFWVNNVSSFYKTEALQENIHDSNFWNIKDAIWRVLMEEDKCVCVHENFIFLFNWQQILFFLISRSHRRGCVGFLSWLRGCWRNIEKKKKKSDQFAQPVTAKLLLLHYLHIFLYIATIISLEQDIILFKTLCLALSCWKPSWWSRQARI